MAIFVNKSGIQVGKIALYIRVIFISEWSRIHEANHTHHYVGNVWLASLLNIYQLQILWIIQNNNIISVYYLGALQFDVTNCEQWYDDTHNTEQSLALGLMLVLPMEWPSDIIDLQNRGLSARRNRHQCMTTNLKWEAETSICSGYF